MSGVNKVTILGNLGRDVEYNGKVAKFSVATSESWRDKQSGEKQERTEWHRVACFGKLAEICQQYLHKGSKVYIEGKIQTSKYEKNGETRYSTEIIAREMQMLSSRDTQQATVVPIKPQTPEEEDFPDSIPF